MTVKEISSHINRSVGSITARAKQLGLSKKREHLEPKIKKHPHWNDDEIKFIIENNIRLTREEIAKELGRTATAVTSKARKLGLKSRSKEIEEYIEKNACKEDLKTISSSLNIEERTVREKAIKAGKIKTSTYTKKELDYIKGNYNMIPVKEIAKTLKRKPECIRAVAKRIGLNKTKIFVAEQKSGEA